MARPPDRRHSPLQLSYGPPTFQRREYAPICYRRLPRDAASHPIIGRGPAPTIAIDDPTIASGVFDESVTVGRVLRVEGLAVGTTSFHLTWGSAQLTLVVTVPG